MTPAEGLEIVKALATIAAALNETAEQVVARVILLDDQRAAVINEALTHYKKFHDASLVERGAMLGITLIEVQPGTPEYEYMACEWEREKNEQQDDDA